MGKKLVKIMGIILIVFAIFNIYLSYENTSFALGDVTKNPDIWIDKDKDVGEGVINVRAKPITGIIRTFGIIASVITLAIIALRIIFGSTEEKANYKQTLVPWAVGAVMLFAMATIPSLVYEAVNGMESGEMKILSDKYWDNYCPSGHLMAYEGSDLVCSACSTDEHKYTWSDFPEGYKSWQRACRECKRSLVDMNGKYYYCNSCGKAYEK